MKDMLSPRPQHNSDTFQYRISQQQTVPQPAITLSTVTQADTDTDIEHGTADEDTAVSPQKQKIVRFVAAAALLALAAAIYLIWQFSPAVTTSSTITTQHSSLNTANNSTAVTGISNNAGGMQVYIAGAVQHPGVYTLEVNARVYQLLQAAGGPLPEANLAALNLAAKLSDGQEIYVAHIGETPPATGGTSSTAGGASQSQLVNINSASADELRQQLSLSSKSAQAIVNYRQQHGPFTSVDGLLTVVSKTIYDKIKTMVTI